MMVDFNKLRKKRKPHRIIDPLEIFRRLPKPPGINDLFTSQAQVLEEWFERRKELDLVIKLHTGGGKTLVGLLIGKSILNETRKPVLYLVPTVQLMNQAIIKANEYSISAVPYVKGVPLQDDFVNAKSIMVATYKALFNGKSKFGVRGDPCPQQVGAIIVDDAHTAFSIVRDAFTITIDAAEAKESYDTLTGLFRQTFVEIDRIGTFDDIVSDSESGVLEVPYWAWREKIEAVRELLRADADMHLFQWPLLRDKLHLCQALISGRNFTITPLFPLVDSFPTFLDSPKRIYMSATIPDDSAIIRTFDASSESVETPISSRSLAGVSERMLLIPELMPFIKDSRPVLEKVLAGVSNKMKLGSVVLTPSNSKASSWEEIATVAEGSDEVDDLVRQLQLRKINGPVVFANRYDGIDLPGDSCRVLVMDGLPRGTSDHELYRASALYGSSSINRIQAQKIEQGVGRGARGSGDFCVILLCGDDLVDWISKEINFLFITNTTRAQLEMGIEISKELESTKDLVSTIKRSFEREKEWVRYHAETLAEGVESEEIDKNSILQASVERKAFGLMIDGHFEKALKRLNTFLAEAVKLDTQNKGYLEQLVARIADLWGKVDVARKHQEHAYSYNRNLIRPKIEPAYVPIDASGEQEKAIVKYIEEYRFRNRILQNFEQSVSYLNPNATSNQFEQSLADLGKYLGFASDRPERKGDNGDVLWLLPEKRGLIIEAKSRKKKKNALTKVQHGQLLVSAEWFKENYPDFKCIKVSVHPNNKATKKAKAKGSYALTYVKLSEMISDTKRLLENVCVDHLSKKELHRRCQRYLKNSTLRFDKLVKHYLKPFEEVE